MFHVKHAAPCRTLCEVWAPGAAVIPAKAGIHSPDLSIFPAPRLDSRFRGNDTRWGRELVQNGSKTPEALACKSRTALCST